MSLSVLLTCRLDWVLVSFDVELGTSSSVPGALGAKKCFVLLLVDPGIHTAPHHHESLPYPIIFLFLSTIWLFCIFVPLSIDGSIVVLWIDVGWGGQIPSHYSSMKFVYCLSWCKNRQPSAFRRFAMCVIYRDCVCAVCCVLRLPLSTSWRALRCLLEVARVLFSFAAVSLAAPCDVVIDPAGFSPLTHKKGHWWGGRPLHLVQASDVIIIYRCSAFSSPLHDAKRSAHVAGSFLFLDQPSLRLIAQIK